MEFPTHIVAAAGIVENEKGEILMVRTPRRGWVFPGGQVEAGENLIDAVKREVKEESGIDIEVDKLFAVSSNTVSYEGFNGVKVVPTKVMMDFICTYIGGELCTSDETPETCWMKKDRVMDRITAPVYRARFQAYLDFNGEVRYLSYVTKPEYRLDLDRKI